MAMYQGACLCGTSQVSIDAAPKFAIRCCCRDCQHVSGGGSLPQFGMDRAAVTLTGPLKTYETTADSGNTLKFGFCGDCGSPMHKTTSKAQDLIFIYAAVVENSDALGPFDLVHEAARPPWDT